jgi:excisionase family DNA binding protein
MQATVRIHAELPLVLTIADVQKVLGVSRVTAYELAHQENFPVIRIGRAIRIPRDGLIRWLESCGGAINGDSNV